MSFISRVKKASQFAEPQVDETGKYPFCLDCPQHCMNCPEPPSYESKLTFDEICERTKNHRAFPDTSDTIRELSGIQLKLDFGS